MPTNRSIVFAVWGSLGDLHPFIAVALKLKQLGYDPLIASVGEYRAKVTAEGIRFHTVRPAFAEIERALAAQLPELTRQVIARPDLLYRRLVFPFLRQSYEDMMDATRDASVVVTGSVCIGARLAAEQRGIPWIGAVLQPMMFVSAYDPPALIPGAWLGALLRRVGPRAATVLLRALKRLIGRVSAPVHELRREIGLARSRVDPLLDGQFSPAGALAMYSPLLGAVQPDYPAPTALTGFAFYDSERGGDTALEPALQSFLAAGPAPIVFTLGSSMVRNPGDFYRDSLQAARQLKRRAVLLVGEGWGRPIDTGGRDDVLVCGYAAYSRLFQHAAAIVHQGGVGTLAQALRAGRPQLIVPFCCDQADNAARALRMGIARTLRRSHYSAASARDQLAALLADHAGAARALAIRDRIALEDGASEAARVLSDHIQARLQSATFGS
jgi:UDP:flavonoid glycosyltransferase YjiC (YdhE family)